MIEPEGKTGNGGNGEVITPIEFTPLTGDSPSESLRLPPASIAIALALFASLLVLWFLLTAKSVLIQSVPATAKLNIEGGAVFQLSGNYLMRTGDYQVRAEAEGYHPLTRQFTVADKDRQLLKLSLKKKPGHLALETNPDTDIVINGTAMGKTLASGTLELRDLAPGSHQLIATRDRYLPYQSNIEIEGLDKTQSLTFSLDPAWGQLIISSTPAGADVSVGGALRGQTPLTTELLHTGEEVAVKYQGYKQWQKRLQVNPGESLTIPDIQLQLADGLVQVSSRPAGATVTVDGQYRGTTPIELELSPGTTHQFSFFLDGYQVSNRDLAVESGKEQQLAVSLKSNTGKIRVIATPADAEVWIDGVRRGTAGNSFSLPARPHRIELRKPGYASQTRTITPRPDLEQALRVRLLTEQQDRWAKTPKSITSPGGQVLKLFKPEGVFTMGASRREAGRRANEILRDVKLTRPFYLGVKEVTNAQFKKFQRQHSSRHVSGITLDNHNQPVSGVSWDQAALYCNWLSQQQGLAPVYTEKNGKVTGVNPQASGYRLPTEAEWAWAARTSKNSLIKFPWGNQYPPPAQSGKPHGNYADISAARIVGRVVKTYKDGYAASSPIGSFGANEKGLYDLGGNVAEWVNDYYGIEFSLSTAATKDPTGPEKGEFRVIRGSSWRHGTVTELRFSFRDYGIDRRDDVGFRVARYVE